MNQPASHVYEGGDDLLGVLLFARTQKALMKEARPVESVGTDMSLQEADQRAAAIVSYELPEHGAKMFFLDGATLGDLAVQFEWLSRESVLSFDMLDRMNLNIPLPFHWNGRPLLVEPSSSIPYFGIARRIPKGWMYIRNVIPGRVASDLPTCEYPLALVVAEGITAKDYLPFLAEVFGKKVEN